MAWIPPGAGELRHSVTFWRRGPAANVGGVVRADWSLLVPEPRSARLLPVRGGEGVQADRIAGVSAWELVVRFDSQTRLVCTADQVIDRHDPTRVFDIRFAEDLEGRGRWIVMQLEKGTGDGRDGT